MKTHTFITHPSFYSEAHSEMAGRIYAFLSAGWSWEMIWDEYGKEPSLEEIKAFFYTYIKKHPEELEEWRTNIHG